MTVRLSASARREQLLDTAVHVFARRGFHDTSMNDVAEAAGVTKPIVYLHFASKRELFLALLDEVGRRLVDRVTKAAADAADGRAQTLAGFRSYFAWVAEDHDAFLLLFGSASSRDPEFAEAVRRVTDEVANAIAPLIAVDLPDAERRILAHGVVGIAEGASRVLVEAGTGFDPDRLAAQVASLAWAGLRGIGRAG
jgi:AcrR family transcriptional regulator